MLPAFLICFLHLQIHPWRNHATPCVHYM
jgi:hypothetical protein